MSRLTDLFRCFGQVRCSLLSFAKQEVQDGAIRLEPAAFRKNLVIGRQGKVRAPGAERFPEVGRARGVDLPVFMGNRKRKAQIQEPVHQGYAFQVEIVQKRVFFTEKGLQEVVEIREKGRAPVQGHDGLPVIILPFCIGVGLHGGYGYALVAALVQGNAHQLPALRRGQVITVTVAHFAVMFCQVKNNLPLPAGIYPPANRRKRYGGTDHPE